MVPLARPVGSPLARVPPRRHHRHLDAPTTGVRHPARRRSGRAGSLGEAGHRRFPGEPLRGGRTILVPGRPLLERAGAATPMEAPSPSRCAAAGKRSRSSSARTSSGPTYLEENKRLFGIALARLLSIDGRARAGRGLPQDPAVRARGVAARGGVGEPRGYTVKSRRLESLTSSAEGWSGLSSLCIDTGSNGDDGDCCGIPTGCPKGIAARLRSPGGGTWWREQPALALAWPAPPLPRRVLQSRAPFPPGRRAVRSLMNCPVVRDKRAIQRPPR